MLDQVAYLAQSLRQVVDTAAHTILKRAVLVVLEVVVLVVLVLVVLVALVILLQYPHRKVITAAQWQEPLATQTEQVVVAQAQLEALEEAALAVTVLLLLFQERLHTMPVAVVVAGIALPVLAVLVVAVQEALPLLERLVLRILEAAVVVHISYHSQAQAVPVL
jgi:hypothetical protein